MSANDWEVRCVFALIAGTLALFVGACAPSIGRYALPADLPPSERAVVTLDQRITEFTVEGKLPPVDNTGASAKEFVVESGCLAFTVKFEESFFIWGEDKAAKNHLGRGLGASLANTEVHDYESLKPIRFFVSARPGYKYWVTASFTGDQFLPRVVELDPSGDASAKFQPDVPCGGKAPEASSGDAAPSPSASAASPM